ncbi:NAD-dependent epimerase/dehydratase family protein [Stutzerimonas stutzeri]|uniref:NAD-dependent epimerase/dehydratase family protein n=1 Tax=Stutzerimonas stutzeri TaxID=316 RepID=UPI0036D8CBBE
MKRILITGASGFLGSALALHFHEMGYCPSLLLRAASNLHRLKGLESCFEIGRCSTDQEIRNFVTAVQPDVVIHTACMYGRDGESRLELLEANVKFGLVIMQGLLANKKPSTFINTGTVLSSEVSPYALSKSQFTQWGSEVSNRSESLRFVNVRLQHMYGPGDNLSKFTTHVLHACHRNEPTLKLTAGEQLRDFIYIDDVVSAYATLLEHCSDFEPFSDIELGSGIAPTVRHFVETAHALIGSSTELLFGAVPYRTSEAMHCQAEISRMKALGWTPKYDLVYGLKKTIELEFSK